MTQQLASQPRRSIVFHADDLGMNSAVDEGIFDCFERGVLTSTSVLANGPSAADALQRMRQVNSSESARCSTIRERLGDDGAPFDLGVHVNLVQGRPLTGDRYPSQLLDRDGRFVDIGKLFWAVVSSGGRWMAAITAELSAQMAWVVDHGVRPTHVNGHRYVELVPGVGEAILGLLPRYSIGVVRTPLESGLWRTTMRTRGFLVWALAQAKRALARSFDRLVRQAQLKHADDYFGTAHAGHVDLESLRLWLAGRRDECACEVGVHPGGQSQLTSAEARDGWHDPLANVRSSERDLLCSSQLVELLRAHHCRLTRLARAASAFRV
jgi:predicted glycoside hydrolase/deacetylase ChbG (UPF0249 family)